MLWKNWWGLALSALFSQPPLRIRAVDRHPILTTTLFYPHSLNRYPFAPGLKGVSCSFRTHQVC